MNNSAVLFAPTIPLSQAIDAPITLSLNGSSNFVANSSSCTAQEGPFRLDNRKKVLAPIQIVLPSPEKWLRNLEKGGQAEGGDMLEAFYSFIADLDHSQLLGCFASNTPPIRDYMLQSVPMKPSDSLFNAYGYLRERGGLDLKPGLRLKIERAFFRPVAPGEESDAVKNYLGVSSSFFDVEDDQGTLQFRQVGTIQYSPESLEKEGAEGSRDLDVQRLPNQRQYRLLFYTFVVPKEQGISAAVIGASDAGELDELETELRAHPEAGCERVAVAKGKDCLDFKGFVTVTAQIKIELNGQSRFVDWGTKLRSVLPKNALKSLRIERLYLGSYYEVHFDPASSNVLSLALVGGDRVTWSKGSSLFH